MFGRKKYQTDEDRALSELSDELAIPARPQPRHTNTPPAPVPARPPATASMRPIAEIGRSTEPVAKPTASENSRPSNTTVPAPRDGEIRKLIVGREISLAGEITACDRLVVEGSVEANLANCRDIDIAETGLYKGSASIEEAEVRGRFEGTLNVRRRLLVRASGRITGTVRYGQIEIECGGQVSGDIQAQGMSDAGASVASARSTVVPLSDEAKI